MVATPRPFSETECGSLGASIISSLLLTNISSLRGFLVGERFMDHIHR